jgi:hypothetical protein
MIMKKVGISLLLFMGGISWMMAQPHLGVEIYNNEVRGTMNIRGSLFWDFSYAGFSYPGSIGAPNKRTHTIFAQGLWLGGRFANGNPIVAAATYDQKGFDYISGPIYHQDGDKAWDKIWYVEGHEIRSLIADWDDNGVINNTPSNALMQWPGRGNPWFEGLTGLTLPDRDMAPFFDLNGDGIYDPWQGDYPVLRTDCEAIIPGSMGWTIFNDATVHTETNSPIPLRVEVQTTVFSFLPTGLDPIDHTVFVKQEITNFNPNDIQDFIVGHWLDADIGCHIDDLMGCEPSLNTFYAYNDSDFDTTPCPAGIQSYLDYPPVQTATFLNKPLGAFIQPIFPTFSMVYPSIYYNFLKGIWRDGTPITIGGSGYLSSSDTTTFLFHDRPSDSTGWSAWTSLTAFDHTRMVGSTEAVTLQTGQTYTLYSAYTVHRQLGLLVPEMVDFALDNVPLIQAFFDNCFNWPGVNFEDCQQACVWPGDLDNNGMVNNLDLLYYGVRNGTQGLPREFVYSGWRAQTSMAWNDVDMLPENARHTDADGNGIIERNDADIAIDHMYRTRPGHGPWGGSNEPGDELTFQRIFNSWTANDTILEAGGRFELRLRFKNPGTESIYGLGYTISWDTNVVKLATAPAALNLIPNAFVNGSLNNILQRPGALDIYVTRTDGVPIDLEQWIMFFGLRFELVSDLPPTSHPVTTIRYQNYLLLREDGSSIPIGAHNQDIQYGPLTSVEGLALNSGLRLWPNPAKNTVYLALSEEIATQATSLSLLNGLGQQVWHQTLEPTTMEATMMIPLEGLSPGIYVVLVLGRSGSRWQEKLMVE